MAIYPLPLALNTWKYPIELQIPCYDVISEREIPSSALIRLQNAAAFILFLASNCATTV